jgi:hypothetical protein
LRQFLILITLKILQLNIKKIALLILLLSLSSCVSIMRSLLGNQIIDHNYEPLGQNSPFYVAIPYVIEDGFITIKAKINNSIKDYNFIFDTGAKTTVSDSIAQELKLEYGETAVGRDANGSNINGLTYRTNISIGVLQIQNIRVNSSALDLFEKKCNHKFDGVIGANVLKQGCYYFDAATRKLVITNQKDKLPIDKLQNGVSLKRKMGQPYIYVKGYRNEWLLFDSGFGNGSIMIDEKSKLINHNTKPIKEKYNPQKGMASEQIKLTSFFNQKIRLGNLNNTMAVVKHDKRGNNLIGNQIIQNNDVIIDVLHKKFYITSFHKPTILDSISNLNFRFKDNIVIIGALTKNSTIEKMGLTINDTVVKINNKILEVIKNECDFEVFKKEHLYTKNQFSFEIKKNNKIETFIISKKILYE